VKAIFGRLRRLENAAAPAEREREAVNAILEARKSRLGPDYRPSTLSPHSFDACETIADEILRARLSRPSLLGKLKIRATLTV
jgi:hypothetical protein